MAAPDQAVDLSDDVGRNQRVRDAIAQTRAFAAGDLTVGEAVSRRGGQAGAAAREALTLAATAAAYAAEQAAAVAHMGAHAFGAAGYAAKAAALASGQGDRGRAVLAQVEWQLAALTPPMADALASLPRLGEDRGGPLAPGRLAHGLVGDAISTLQAQLQYRSVGR